MRKILSVILCFTMIGGAPTLAKPKQSKEEKLKSQVVSLGVNKAVGVILSSGELVTGRITEIKDTAFTVETLKEGKTANREIRFNEVNKLSAKALQKSGKFPGKLSTGLIIGGVIFAVVVATAVIKNQK